MSDESRLAHHADEVTDHVAALRFIRREYAAFGFLSGEALVRFDAAVEALASQAEVIQQLHREKERLTGVCHMIQNEMNSRLGPSWPPNDISGERVDSWRELICNALKSLPASPAPRPAPPAPQEHEE